MIGNKFVFLVSQKKINTYLIIWDNQKIYFYFIQLFYLNNLVNSKVSGNLFTF